MIIAPSILSIKKEDLRNKLNEFLTNNIKYLHIDIMDGIFVTNNTEKAELLESINDYPFYYEAHLMVKDPLNYLESFKNAKANMITFHYEAVDNVLETINEIKKMELDVGISIKPKTDVKVIEPYLSLIDLVLIMSVEPGYGGQSYLDSADDKIKYLAEYKKNHHLNYLIEVDGGINPELAIKISKLGCDMVVMGSYLVKNDVKETVSRLEKI